MIGTRGTIASGAYEKAIRALRSDAKVTARACPLLVPLIEEGRLTGPITDAVIREYLEPMIAAGIDTLVLGCTHYPLARAAIQNVLGDDVVLVDSAENSARALQQLLIEEALSSSTAERGALRVALTDMPDHFLRVAEEALQLEIKNVELYDLATAAVGP